ncbi:MAG: hypothetical protein LUE19_02590 [Clostridiales bacterium]|nr:hypothetical protein [Clostridiales bacterium]
MAEKKWIHESGKDFDCTALHGKYCTINMVGQDVGYARVGIVSSGPQYLLFQFRGKRGLAAKAFIKDITEVKMTERKLKKETELIVEDWDEDVNPFCYFVGDRCDIHMHQTRLFEATPGFFGAKLLYVDSQNQLIRIKENSKQFNVSISMICGIMQSVY